MIFHMIRTEFKPHTPADSITRIHAGPAALNDSRGGAGGRPAANSPGGTDGIPVPDPGV